MNKLTVSQKKWLLAIHIMFAGIMLGGAATTVILSITAMNTASAQVLQACYTIMHLLSKTSVRVSTIGTVVTGILLSVLTNWGLFRYYWIIVKEILTLLSIGIGIVGFYYWSLEGLTLVTSEGLDALQNPAFTVNHIQLWIGIVLQILSLTSMTVISVFKPWGRRQTGK
jgi:uncharacterized membrane protein